MPKILSVSRSTCYYYYYTLNLFQDTPSSLQTLLHEVTAHPLEPQRRPPDQEVLIPFQATKPAL